jgi:serine/threonine-protein kinase RsbW
VRIDVAVCLPQEADTVALMRSATRSMLTLFGVTEDCVDDIGLALSEACTNVIAHASTDDEYEVLVGVDDRQCVISVRDAGHDFDAAQLTGMMPDLHSTRGRGVAIVRALMDSVDFACDPEGGTVVRLVRALKLRDDGPLVRLRSPPPTT